MTAPSVPFQRHSWTGLAIGAAVTIAINAVILVTLVLVTAAHQAPPTIPTIRITQTAPPAPAPPQTPAVATAHAAPTPRIPQPPLPALPAAALGDPDLALPPPLAPAEVTLPPLMPAWSVANAGNRSDSVDLDRQVAPPADTPPVLIGNVNLESFYPLNARIHGITGASSLTIAIDATGAVTAATVQESSPRGVFDEAAQNLALHLHFKPAQASGKAVAVTLPYQIYWTLGK